MKVELLHYTPLHIADIAISKCWDKTVSDDKKCERIERVANKNRHASTIEHLSYSFDIDGISRSCLQELARHRISSFSVKSTRYTLKELKDSLSTKPFTEAGGISEELYNLVPQFCVVPPDLDQLDSIALRLSLANSLGSIIVAELPNDKSKYMLPEAYKTSLVWTINARSLQNFLSLRTSKSALWEIRDLANAIYLALPEEQKFLFKEFLS